MKKFLAMEKYPVCATQILKSESHFQTMEAILEFFKQKIAAFIAIFDHYTHTQNIQGEIAKEIKDARNLIFCFGVKIPNPTSLALRPRSFGICELEESFAIEFLQAPNPNVQEILESWIEELKA
jgi:hypothetical protein